MTMVLLSALDLVPPFRGQARLQTGGRGKWNNEREILGMGRAGGIIIGGRNWENSPISRSDDLVLS